MPAVTVLYPAKEGARFDFAYYRDTHCPLVEEVWNPQSVEVLRGEATPGGPSPFILTATFRFASAEAMAASLGHPRGPELRADIVNFTDAVPLIQIGSPLA